MIGHAEARRTRRAARARARAARARRGDWVSMSGPPLMHGTGCWLGMMVPHMLGGTAALLESRGLDPVELWTRGRARARQPARDRRRRVREAAAARARRESRAAGTRPACAAHGVVGRDVLARGEAGPDRDTSRSSRSPTCSARPRAAWGNSIVRAGRHRRDRALQAQPDDARCSPRTAARCSRARARSAWSRTAAWCRSATTRIPRSRRARSARSNGVRYAFPGDMATVEADGTHHAARPRLELHQHAAARRSSPRRSRRRSRSTPPSRTRWCSACPTSASGSASSASRRSRRVPTAAPDGDPRRRARPGSRATSSRNSS